MDEFGKGGIKSLVAVKYAAPDTCLRWRFSKLNDLGRMRTGCQDWSYDQVAAQDKHGKLTGVSANLEAKDQAAV